MSFCFISVYDLLLVNKGFVKTGIKIVNILSLFKISTEKY